MSFGNLFGSKNQKPKVNLDDLKLYSKYYITDNKFEIGDIIKPNPDIYSLINKDEKCDHPIAIILYIDLTKNSQHRLGSNGDIVIAYYLNNKICVKSVDSRLYTKISYPKVGGLAELINTPSLQTVKPGTIVYLRHPDLQLYDVRNSYSSFANTLVLDPPFIVLKDNDNDVKVVATDINKEEIIEKVIPKYLLTI